MLLYSNCCFILGIFLREVYIYKYLIKDKLFFLYCKMYFYLKKNYCRSIRGNKIDEVVLK